MVYIRGESIPGELVGIDEASSYTQALFHYTAKMDAEKAKMSVKKAHEVAFPVDSLYGKIKTLSLFPNVYSKPQKHRTFPKVVVEDDDDSRLTKKPSKKSREDGVLM